MKDYDAYLFDADGTIIDTRDMINTAFMQMADVLGVRLERENIQNSIGLPMDAQLRALLGLDHDDAFYEKGKKAYSDSLMENYRSELKTFPGVLTGLRELKEMGKKLAVVTSRRLMSLEAFLNHLGFDKYFDLFVTPESTERHKPDPEPALYAMKMLGVGPERCVFIGDATFDIECGKAAGMDTVLVGWGMDSADWVVKPDVIIDEFSELLPS